jgi:4-amino-4-deoxy-L-arabinose transferase-like glycosyltransferase
MHASFDLTKAAQLVDRNAILLLAIILAAIAFSRFFAVCNDPAWWVHPDFFNDEGWWSDSARGRLFFGTYFADDFGTAYLVAPGYTFLLQGTYSLFGIGLAQMRIVSAAAGVLTVLIAAATVGRKAGKKEAVLCALLLGASPFFWAFNRVAFTETLQGLFVTSAFCLYVSSRRKVLGPFLSGLLLSISVALKINAAVIGVLPIVLAVCATSLHEAKAANARMSLRNVLPFFSPFIWGFLGLASGVAAFLGLSVIPNWHAFRAMVFSEARLSDASIAQILQLPGAALVSVDSPSKAAIVWRLAVLSPTICFGAWLGVLRLTPRIHKSPASAGVRLGQFEAGCIGWMLATWVFISLSSYQPDRRFVLLLPPMAMAVAGTRWSQDRRSSEQRAGMHRSPRGGALSSWGLWLILSLPVLLMIKPVAVNTLVRMAGQIHLGDLPGLSTQAAGTVVMFVWLLLIVPISRLRLTGERIRGSLLSKGSIGVFLLLLVCETAVVGIGVARGRSTFVDAQLALASLVERGETVLGHAAASAFLPYRVRTVRRSTPDDGSPPPNPDVWERTHPRYILELEQFNYRYVEPRYQDLISEKGYFLVSRLSIGPEHNRQPKFVLGLYERRE